MTLKELLTSPNFLSGQEVSISKELSKDNKEVFVKRLNDDAVLLFLQDGSSSIISKDLLLNYDGENIIYLTNLTLSNLKPPFIMELPWNFRLVYKNLETLRSYSTDVSSYPAVLLMRKQEDREILSYLYDLTIKTLYTANIHFLDNSEKDLLEVEICEVESPMYEHEVNTLEAISLLYASSILE